MPALTRTDYLAVATTVAMALVCIGVAFVTSGQSGMTTTVWPLAYAGSLGALGGLVHEFFQSGGKILFFERKPDGIYLGSLAGMVMGAVAALAIARTFESGTTSLEMLGYEAFMAGVGLKGLTEASAGQATSPATNTPIQNLPAPPAQV
jgi:hypothetical protein